MIFKSSPKSVVHGDKIVVHGDFGNTSQTEPLFHPSRRAIDWLITRHGKAVRTAVKEMLAGLFEDNELSAVGDLDEEAASIVLAHAYEWLLAEGLIRKKGQLVPAAAALLDHCGAMLSVSQREWVSQLAQSPLRLYRVTDVVPGKQITLWDALDEEAAPAVIDENQLSSLGQDLVHRLIGARVMMLDGRLQVPEVIYPLMEDIGEHVETVLRRGIDEIDPGQKQAFVSFVIRKFWLAQYLDLPEVSEPEITDFVTSEPFLLITDTYRVTDWAVLTQRLSSQPDVVGDRESGWSQLVRHDDDERRPVGTVNVGKKADTIEVFYSTHGKADQGRAWLEALAGETIHFVEREVLSPHEAVLVPPEIRR